jgi:hypothetical protein
MRPGLRERSEPSAHMLSPDEPSQLASRDAGRPSEPAVLVHTSSPGLGVRTALGKGHPHLIFFPAGEAVGASLCGR